MLGFSDVSFNYPDGPTLFRDLNFGIDMDSRLAMVGPNGGSHHMFGVLVILGGPCLMVQIATDLKPKRNRMHQARRHQHGRSHAHKQPEQLVGFLVRGAEARVLFHEVAEHCLNTPAICATSQGRAGARDFVKGQAHDLDRPVKFLTCLNPLLAVGKESGSPHEPPRCPISTLAHQHTPASAAEPHPPAAVNSRLLLTAV